MRALFWCGIAILIGIYWLVFGSASDRFTALLLISIALLTSFPFAVGVALQRSGAGIVDRAVRVAGYVGIGCLAILFGGSLLVFAYIWLFLAWQQASHGDYALPGVLAVLFGAAGLGTAIWFRNRLRRSKQRVLSSPTPADPTDFTVYPPT